MADSSYDVDFLVWSDRQADLLERLARGERVNDAVDWPHLIEEVRDLGRSELNAVDSLLSRAVEHLLRCAGWPASPDVNHWSSEARAFLVGARRRWAPSMAQRIDLADLYADAAGLVRDMRVADAPPLPVVDECPFSLDDLIVPRPGSPDIAGLVERLRGDPAN